MDNFHVVFISMPSFGELVPTVGFAHHLTNHDPRFSATILIIPIPQRPLVDAYSQSISSTSSSTTINFVHLPPLDPPSPEHYQSPLAFISLRIQQHKLHVKQALTELAGIHPRRVAGLFVDMFCTSMIDVADELGIPCYMFFASPASYLGFTFQLPRFDTELVGSETELSVPSFVNPLPRGALPDLALNRGGDGYFWYLTHVKRYTEVKGIVVNTFNELEPHAVKTVCGTCGVPPVYPVGPVVDIAGPVQWHPDQSQYAEVLKWLDDQPESSVVFLCFGSMGSLSGAQLREIAAGLEQAKFRFLWSVREAPKEKLNLPGEYVNVNEILPDGFLDRTIGFGWVCGWVPQVTILAHRAIGGFVSHCGWNSILESVWYGVPIATWPIYAEQQMNAFLLVRELGLAVEIRLDYREGSDLVLANEIERGIKCLMEGDDEVRRKVKDMSRKSRMALMENGSSYVALASLIEKLTADN